MMNIIFAGTIICAYTIYLCGTNHFRSNIAVISWIYWVEFMKGDTDLFTVRYSPKIMTWWVKTISNNSRRNYLKARWELLANEKKGERNNDLHYP